MYSYIWSLVLWPPHAKSWLIGKDSDAGRDWGQEEKGMTEDETAGWHHRLDGHEFGWTLGVGDGQGGLACYDSWGHKESDMTERLNWRVVINYQRSSVFVLCNLIEFKCELFLASERSLDSSVQSLSCVQLFATPWIAAHQASLSITNTRSSLRFMSTLKELNLRWLR